MGIHREYSTVPVQRLPLNKKGKEWKERNIDAYIGKAYGSTVRGRPETEDLKIKYDLYNSKFDIRDIEYVIDPFKVGDSLPGSPQNFNIIRPKIDLLIGEESKRPENMKVIQSGDEGASKAEELQLDLLMRYVMAQLGPQPEDEQGQVQTPEQIQRYIQYEYSDIAEKTAHYALKYLKERLNTRNEFLKGWKDALIAGKEIYYVGTDIDDPYLERVNPVGFYFDKSPDIEFIEDGDWAVRHMLMTPSAVHDKLFDKLTNKQLDELEELSGGKSMSGSASDVNYNKVLYKEPIGESMTSGSSSDGTYLDVYHVTWKSQKKVGFLTTFDEETGEEIEVLVDEHYRTDPDEQIEWKWVDEVWEGYKVGESMYVGIEPLENQSITIDSPNSQKLPYVGAIYSDDNSEYTSLIDIMRPLQYMYIIIWFRLEVALARDKGRVLTMDITQIPKSMGIDTAKWMHYLSTLGVNLINPYEEGWDIPGRAGGQAASFNQISSVDLSMSKVIGDYIGLMDKIEQMVGELTGVSKQRQGSISQNELVGNVERSVIQSSHITEPLFWKHNQVKKRAYTQLLNAAKSSWADSSKQKLHFIMDDASRAFITLSEDFTYADFDVFISDSSKEDRDIQALKNLSQAAVQGGASLSEVAEMMTLDNVTLIKNKLKELDAKKEQVEQQVQQQQQEIQMAKIKSDEDAKAEENRIKEEDSIRKAQTDIEVALISADSKQDNGENAVKLQLDREKISLQKEKQIRDAEINSKKVQEDIRNNKVNESIKRSELEIKRKQANNKPKTN